MGEALELRDFIERRLTELEPQVAELESKLEPLRSEVALLRRAKAAINKPGSAGEPRKPRIRPPRAGSIQGQALRVLRSEGISQMGLTAGDIGLAIADRFGRCIPRESLAPQLSRLCQSGELTNVDGRYIAAEPRP